MLESSPNQNETVAVTSDFYFAIIPEWVLALTVSSHAIRVYCCLRRYADNTTGECYPSRRLLAMRSHVSVSTLDRALKELGDAGAITIEHRKTDAGDYTSNLYTVLSFPKGVVSKSVPPRIRADRTGVITGGEQTRAISTISNNRRVRASLSPAERDRLQYETRGTTASHMGMLYSELLESISDHQYRDIIIQAFLEIAPKHLIDIPISIPPPIQENLRTWHDKYD